MKREFLEELGIEKGKVDQIMAEHGRTLNSTKEELTSAQSELETLKEQIFERDKQLDELKGKAQGNEDLQATIDALKEANEQAKQAYEEQLHEQKFNYELERSLITANARNPKAVRALIDTDVIKLEDGEIKGLKEQLESLKESDSYLFADTESSAPKHIPGSSKKSNPPKEVDPYEAGKLKAMERHGLNKEED